MRFRHPDDSLSRAIQWRSKGGGNRVTTTVRTAGRVAVDLESVPAAGTDNDMTTDGESDFGPAAGAASITHAAICDAASSGNILLSKALASTVAVEAGEQVSSSRVISSSPSDRNKWRRAGAGARVVFTVSGQRPAAG